ncbi:MAG TPA: enoyl-CoA hydratase/isomerase family protein [Blastocatellia bacterium]|nr:enoyl-CoA hydratase/isomerase family protein [Blastocatellia bacterium]
MKGDSPEPYVLSDRRGSVLTLTLNRPEKSNSLHPDLVLKLTDALRGAESDEGVNAVILTGAGRSFCAGLDLGLLVSWTPDEKLAYLKTVTAMFNLVWTLPQPVIAAVNGPAIAGGFDLAAFCDIRLAAREAVFGQAEINIGLTQIIHPLYKTIGLARAKELAMTGQNIPAEEAYRIGLVNHIYPGPELMARAAELAEVLASRPREALIETKRLTRELIDLDTKSALNEVNETFVRRLNSDEHREHVTRFYEKMKAGARGREPEVRG